MMFTVICAKTSWFLTQIRKCASRMGCTLRETDQALGLFSLPSAVIHLLA